MFKINDEVALWVGIIADVVLVMEGDMYVVKCQTTNELKLMYEYAPYQYRFWDVPKELNTGIL